eukprot:3413250-Prymnesium_polylepis.1
MADGGARGRYRALRGSAVPPWHLLTCMRATHAALGIATWAIKIADGGWGSAASSVCPHTTQRPARRQSTVVDTSFL